MTDEQRLLRNCFERTTSGTGHVEVTFVDWTFKLAEGTLRASSPLATLTTQLNRVSRKRGTAFGPHLQMGMLLERTGYTDIIHRKHRLPLSPSSRDPKQHNIGRKMMALLDNVAQGTEGDGNEGINFLESISLGLLVDYLQISAEEVRDLVDKCVKQAWESEGHPYVELHSWTARRP